MIFSGEIEPTGTHTIGGMNSTPLLILFTGTNRNTFDSIITTGFKGGFIGFACEVEGGSAIAQYCEFAMMSPPTCSNMSAHACYAQSSPGSFGSNTLYEGDVVGLNGDGFTINFTTGAGGYKVFYLALTDIDAVYSFLHASEVDGDPRDEDVGFDPSVVVCLGQWRNTGHTLPKSTSAQPWASSGIADLAGGSGVLGAEWMLQAYTKGTRLGQHWDTVINSPGTTAKVAALSKPFSFGSDLALGYLDATNPALNTVRLNEPGVGGSGFDFALAVGPQECVRMECGRIVAQFAEQTFNLTELTSTPEGAFFINMEAEPQVQSNQAGRWGFGVATPSYEASWLIDASQAVLYQTTSSSWISSVTTTQVSHGTTDFSPPTGDIGFITSSLAAGGGVSGFGALLTQCREELIVALDPLNTSRWIGSWHESRGGIPDAEELV